MRRTRLFLVCIIIFIAGLVSWRVLIRQYTVPILMYHSVSDRDDIGSLSVTPENFRKQMTFLDEKGYNVIALGELVEGIERGKCFPRNTVVITFDDGFRDNFTEAFPVLYKFSFPATVFVVTGKVGKSPEWLDWEQVRIMMHHGICIGSHTRTHAYLPDVTDKEALWDEIRTSREELAGNTLVEPKFFCYPIGGFSEEIKALVRKAGYRGACATNRGYDPRNRDVYELNRIKVSNSDGTRPFNFRVKLSGYYDLFRSRKAPN